MPLDDASSAAADDGLARSTALTAVGRSLLVQAGAGSGKTSVLRAVTGLQRPEGAAGRLGAQGRDLTLHTGAYDRFLMTRLDGLGWTEALAGAVARLRPQAIHLHGLDRIGAEALAALRPRKAARGSYRRPDAKESTGLDPALADWLAHRQRA